MKNLDIIRAWKDEEYRQRLTEAERAFLPANPAGLIELADTELSLAAGGLPPRLPDTTKAGGCPPPYTKLPNICGNTFDCPIDYSF
jgi:mersacidin/lichenicidin family type 2 lantibiotic